MEQVLLFLNAADKLHRPPSGCQKPVLQHLPRRQFRQKFGHPDLPLPQLQQLDLLVVLAAAEDESDGRLFVVATLVFFQPANLKASTTRPVSATKKSTHCVDFSYSCETSPDNVAVDTSQRYFST